jgi:polyphosphate glucokinase
MAHEGSADGKGAVVGAATADTDRGSAPRRPLTLAIDVGGTGLKASVLDADGRMVADRVRVATAYPSPPERLVDELVALVAPLPHADRVSVGFPGVVRNGLVLTAPHFVTASGPGSRVVPSLVAAWRRFDLARALSERLSVPVRVANDADLQGMDVVKGEGVELVVTLGTGVGTAVFSDGRLAPHLELAHHPFRKGQTYNEQLGDAALHRIGPRRWRKRVRKALANFSVLLNYDHLYVGGGNARLLVGHLGPEATIVDNIAGILGGIRLWEDVPAASLPRARRARPSRPRATGSAPPAGPPSPGTAPRAPGGGSPPGPGSSR